MNGETHAGDNVTVKQGDGAGLVGEGRFETEAAMGRFGDGHSRQGREQVQRPRGPDQPSRSVEQRPAARRRGRAGMQDLRSDRAKGPDGS